MNVEISDNRLKTFWQKWLWKHPEYHLPNLKHCGAQVIKQLGTEAGVFVLRDKNSNETTFFGNAKCHSAWACPKCTAEVMAKKAKRIAAAIDALKQKNKQTAIMITFTIPHTKKMTCKESFEIFSAVWRKFSRGGLRAHQTTGKYILKNDKDTNEKYRGRHSDKENLRTGKKGELRTYKKGRNPYGAFRAELGITHNVRVFEFTYGENSWHPHIHALFWVPTKNLKKIKNYEQELINHWWHCIKTVTTKYWSEKFTDKTELQKFLEKVYPDYKKESADGHKSLYISKTKEGEVRPISSSWYLAGWGGDKEISGLSQKKARNGNLTPYQIIHLAYEQFILGNTEESEKYLRLYAQYAQTTFKHRRLHFSETGINKIINQWLKENQYKEVVKKKATDKEKNWETVYWFNEKQWYEILLKERRTGHYIRDDILTLARAPNAKEHIIKFLEIYDIHTNNQNNKTTQFIQDLMNKKIA